MFASTLELCREESSGKCDSLLANLTKFSHTGQVRNRVKCVRGIGHNMCKISETFMLGALDELRKKVVTRAKTQQKSVG